MLLAVLITFNDVRYAFVEWRRDRLTSRLERLERRGKWLDALMDNML
jgi:hypothetical protein